MKRRIREAQGVYIKFDFNPKVSKYLQFKNEISKVSKDLIHDFGHRASGATKLSYFILFLIVLNKDKPRFKISLFYSLVGQLFKKQIFFF